MQSPGVNLSLSPAGQSLFGAAGGTEAETEEEKRRRLLGLQAAQKNIAGSLGVGGLSPAGSSLFNLSF